MKKESIIVLVIVILAFGVLPASTAAQYTITDLGTLGGNNSSAYGINDSGQVVGSSRYIPGNGDHHAFFYDGTTMRDIGTLGGSRSTADGLNNSGKIVGWSYLSGDSVTRAFLYDGATMRDLETSGGSDSYARGINDSGQIVGYSQYIPGNSTQHAFMYDGTTMRDLGTLGGDYSYAFSINNSSQVVGSSGYIPGNNAHHAFLYDGVIMQDLGTLGGDFSCAYCINDNGVIVGNSSNGSEAHAFLYDGSIMRDLGTLGGDYSNANSINDSGQVVGESNLAGNSTQHAFIYKNGVMIDLNTLLPEGCGWELSWANGINDSGQIVGAGYINGQYHAYMMSPPPESVLVLLQVPTGGERVMEDSTYEIKWTKGVSVSDVLIEYSDNNGIDWYEIATVQDVNSYDWQVPGPASKDCLVRVTNVDYPSIIDTSDDTFLIYACEQNLVGDFNHDCQVDLLDFVLVAQNWLEKSQTIIYSFPMNSACHWATEGQWEFGQPTGNGGAELGYPDPGNGYTGLNVYGVNLNGDYTLTVGGPYYLTAGPFNCTGFHNMKLRFARWLNTDAPSYIQNKIQVSNDGTIWHTFWENTGAVTDSNWQMVEYNLSSTADNQATVYLKWGYEILDGRAYLCSGWNIDDVELLGEL